MRQFMTHSNKDLSRQPAVDTRQASVPFVCNVIRSKRRTMVIHVRHDSVEARVPMFVTSIQVQAFIDKHRDWIIGKLEHKAAQEAQLLTLKDGGTIYYKGKTHTVRFIEDSRDEIVISGTEFRFYGRRMTEASAARALQRWLLAQARAVLPQRTRALADYLQAGPRLKEVVFRKTKTKWGHCTASGRIQFNWLIMLAPDAIIDYMICHEVCHLLQMNHSRKFWSLVESVCPDYRIYVKWLRKHEHRLWL